MYVKFDSDAAMELIHNMCEYCEEIQNDTTCVFAVLNDAIEWNDSQSRMFRDRLTELTIELNNVLRLESDYMKMYNSRVEELRNNG